MVQIRQLQQRAPGNFRFWGRVKLRIGRRRHLLRGSLNNPARIFKDLNNADKRRGILFGLRRGYTRERLRIGVPTRNWGFAGPGRWIYLARKKFKLSENARVNWLASPEKSEKEDEDQVLTTDSGLTRGRFTERIWGLEKRIGRANIADWIYGRGRRSTHVPLIGDSEDEEDEDGDFTRRDSNVGDVFCGCSGGMIWRSREKLRLFTEEVVQTEDQRRELVMKLREDDQPVLPDDIVEMCLARTPFDSLMRAKAVCKKWKSLTSSPHFLQLRESIRTLDPWLFLFGLSRNGVCLGQIQALDPSSSRWHTIKADILTGRLSYSLTSVKSVIYVVGGCASNLSTASSRSNKESLKTLKTVLMYTPLTGSWRKVCPLTTERAAPIVGVFNLRESGILSRERSRRDFRYSVGKCNFKWSSDTDSGQSTPDKRKLHERGSRLGGELAVYGDAETRGKEFDLLYRSRTIRRLELTDENGNISHEGLLGALEAEFKKLDVHGNRGVPKEQRNFGLIVLGGQGTWNEQLDSGEIYDPVVDNWREIPSLPGDHGTPCAGVVCKNFFYVYSESNKLAAYDLINDTWHSIRVSQAPVRLLDYTPKLVSCLGRVFLLGVTWGMLSETGSEMATRMIWELNQDPTATGWVNVSQHPDAPLDWNAVFVADEEIIFGVEMFKIFGQMLDFVTVCKISRSGGLAWERGSRMEMGMQEMDPSSCLTKTAVVVRL